MEEVQSYPNPFNQITTITYKLREDSYVTITIYNLQGQIVMQLVNNQFQEAGPISVEWNAAGFASGAYICTIKTNNFSATKKILLTR